MKITDLTLTLFAWDSIPGTTYGRHTGRFEGRSELGLLEIKTDEGVTGHAFLGSAMRGAGNDAETLIRYQLARRSHVKLEIYDMLGRRVHTLVEAEQNTGVYEVRWGGLNEAREPVASGVYLYRLQADDFVDIKTMILLR